MTTEREMLEFAAKACRIWNDTDYWNGMLKATGEYWSPIDNSADCAAMCAKLSIDTVWEHYSAVCRTHRYLDEQWFKDHDNKEAAWRYAATQVAAKIGGMK